MLKDYIRAAMGKARYEILPDDGTFYGEIPGFDGVYANADTLEDCRDELEEVLEGWILLRISLHMPLPSIFIPNPHQGDIGEGLLIRILRQAKIDRATWEKL